MAKGKKTGGRDFKKGQSGNPNGRPPLPAEIKAARQLNSVTFETLIYKYMHMSATELIEISKNPTTPAIDLIVIKLLSMGIKDGDIARINLLLERTIGKVKDKLEINAQVQNKTLHQQIMDELKNGNK